jgi:acetyl-CoA carboxylase biotin carboxyl carrier protein
MEIRSEMAATVWKVLVEEGQSVMKDETIVILDCMKMEIPVESPIQGTVRMLRVQPNMSIDQGGIIAVIE